MLVLCRDLRTTPVWRLPQSLSDSAACGLRWCPSPDIENHCRYFHRFPFFKVPPTVSVFQHISCETTQVHDSHEEPETFGFTRVRDSWPLQWTERCALRKLRRIHGRMPHVKVCCAEHRRKFALKRAVLRFFKSGLWSRLKGELRLLLQEWICLRLSMCDMRGEVRKTDWAQVGRNVWSSALCGGRTCYAGSSGGHDFCWRQQFSCFLLQLTPLTCDGHLPDRNPGVQCGRTRAQGRGGSTHEPCVLAAGHFPFFPMQRGKSSRAKCSEESSTPVRGQAVGKCRVAIFV